jgi:DNA-binding transcriptional regulator YiaG
MANALAVQTAFDPRTVPAIRRRMGLTQAQVARMADGNVNDVSRLERALQPGELLDRMIGALQTAAGEAPQKD